MPYMFYDPTMLLLIPAIILAFYARNKVNSTFKKFSKYRNRRNLTGKEVAELILRNQGITDVIVEQVPGELSDHYNPRTKTVNLSSVVYGSTSLAAVGVAAHECGHAIQHHKSYAFIKVRDLLLPTANFGGKMAFPIFFIGLILTQFIGELGFAVAVFAIIAYAAVVLFQIVTLPVEFNASTRAKRLLVEYGYLDDEEIGAVKKVLSAAALTYVAAAAMGVLQLLRLVLRLNRRR